MWNFLYSMCQSGNISEASKRRKERWLANVREFLPWISNVTAERDLSGNIRLIIHELDGGKFHPIHVSDGTLMLLGHLAILESGGSIIIVDEPETHLHPDAIHTLMKIYRRYLENPKTSVKQVIITTQSPFVVRNCKPEEIRVVQRRGATSEVLHVADNPLDLQKQLDNAGLSLDEAWLSNIFGGTTA